MFLYSFVPQDRSGKIRWLLEELELPFEVRSLDGEADEHKTESFKKIHPFSMVPVLEDGESLIFESGAIAIYLSDRYTTKFRLAPAVESKWRADYLKWIFLATASLDPLLIKVFGNSLLTEADRSEKMRKIYADALPTFQLLESILIKSQFVAGPEFSAADIMLAQPLEWARKGGLFGEHPKIEKYLASLKERDACKKSGIFG